VAPGPLRAAPLRARCPQGRGAQVTLAGAQTRPRERPHQAILVLAPVRPLRELPPRPPDHDIVDAMGRLHRHRCRILDLVSPTPGRVLFGPAVTISYYPSCSAALDPERYNLANLFYEAVGDDPDGKVVVLASNGYTDVSMGGGRSCCASRSTAAPASSQTAGCATSTSSLATTSPPTARGRRRTGEATRSRRFRRTCRWSSRALA
jgi:hypothetical protein